MFALCTSKHLNEHQKATNKQFICTNTLLAKPGVDIKQTQERKIQTCEMKCLRKVVNKTRWDSEKQTSETPLESQYVQNNKEWSGLNFF